ncbi:exo-beta-1,3-glucanase [Fistulina hepatica ATCC 64428]|uniref:glucan 1,3-beta-glucosidase n=1 Tax=Fistulina hepatica ATCC 64428 TaxID=1128425 RepID=A0A0D7AGJ1_9AGAR|nr:exo-beta-1,3-glucanase [Fistulina hepatica ATCC 64428]
MIFRVLLAAHFLASQVQAFTPGFAYGTDKVRGVNLGGWLVLEPWITPSLFDNTGNGAIIDEWTFCGYQDAATATAALKNHWDTWITESDFADIAAAGLNHVRIPIGYWAFDVEDGEPFIQGQSEYLDKAVSWAKTHGLKVIVDLHGAPGSQNGFDNSGHKLPYPQWQSSPTNIKRTDNIVKTLASKFAGKENVVPIIAPLNEPAGYFSDVLAVVPQYWRDSYENIRYPYGTSQRSNTVEMIHDAFQDLSYWGGFLTYPSYQGVIMDTHHYEIFSDSEVAMTEDQHISTACARGTQIESFDLWIVVGEFSPANTDCAKYVNGRGVGARYDGTYPQSPYVGSCSGLTSSGSSFSADYRTFLRKFWEAQVISFEKGEGWLQWTWKVENADEWSYQAGLKYGWIPRDPTDLKYPDICD